MNLHNINNRIRAIVDDRYDPETGEVFEAGDEESTLLLAELDMNRQEKILHCAMYIQEHNAMADQIRKVSATMAKRAKRHENDAEWLKTWVESNCNADEIFESPDIAVSFRKSTRYTLRTLEDVPKDLIVIPQPQPRLDKTAAKQWTKLHNEPPPGVDETIVKNMQIK